MPSLCRRLAAAETLPAGTHVQPLALPFEIRRHSRQRWALSADQELAWALPPGQMLKPGDRLIDEKGQAYTVCAADEELLRIETSEPRALARAAYHLGNRHVTVEVGVDYLAILPDAVLQAMLKQLGLHCRRRRAPFQPETGAYGGGHQHGHDATFAEDYQLAQAVYRQRAVKPEPVP